jgi:hypothetical protein
VWCTGCTNVEPLEMCNSGISKKWLRISCFNCTTSSNKPKRLHSDKLVHRIPNYLMM